jgi:hypothetical protein
MRRDFMRRAQAGFRFAGLVDHGETENLKHLAAGRDRLRGEVNNLVRSIAAGVAADTVAPGIRARELEISRLEVRLRAPAPEQPRIEELRAALMQRTEEWRKTLRETPQVARVLLRRLIGPLVLHDESQRPDFSRAEAEVKAGLLDGLVPNPPATIPASLGEPSGDVYTDGGVPNGLPPNTVCSSFTSESSRIGCAPSESLLPNLHTSAPRCKSWSEWAPTAPSQHLTFGNSSMRSAIG